MPYKVFFESPNSYKNKYDFYQQGGAPYLLKKFTETIEAQKEKIEEINLSWYLYNNQYLHNYLKQLSKTGIKVNVVSIPLEGYDNNNPKSLIDLTTYKKQNSRVTKYALAREIYGEMYRDKEYPNFNLYCFSHIYVRSEFVKKFSRGKLPYSLHIKSAYIKKKKGFMVFMSSSNFAVRDLVKFESLVCMEDEQKYEESFSNFYVQLIENSIPIKNYKREFNTTLNTFKYLEDKNSPYSFIAAPFYFNSAFQLEKSLIQHISSAKDRIFICAQHLAAFNYTIYAKYHSQIQQNEKRKGILGLIINKAKNGIQVKCLSQTFASPLEKKQLLKGSDFRKPANGRNFQEFYKHLSLTNNAEYYVNDSLHSKFIIIDDKLIYCTYNYTPTQFIYLDKVKIPSFKEMKDLSYEGIHCEVSAHVVIEEEGVVNTFVDNFHQIINDARTKKVLGV